MVRDGGLLNTCKRWQAIGNTVGPLPSWPPIARHSQLQRRSHLLRIAKRMHAAVLQLPVLVLLKKTPSPAAR